MRRVLVALSALALVGLGLSGCGLFRFDQREPWRTQAEEACLSQRLVQPSAYMSRASKIEGPGACGMDYPFRVAAFSAGSVGVSKQVTLACPIIPRIETWLDEVVKPAASLYFGVPVVDLRAGSYSCRPRNNQNGAKLSEHSFGNALDIMAFVLADGREVTVMKGWRGAPAEQDFLREVFVGACRHFNTVLGPGSDMFHYDHFHIDLARHDPRGQRRVCKPMLKFSPRLDGLVAGGRAQTWTAADLPATEVEEDGPVEAPGSARMSARSPAPAYGVPQPMPAARAPQGEAPAYGLAQPAPPARSASALAPPAPVASAPLAPPAPRSSSPAPGTLFPEPYRAPLYNRPPVAGQPPQLLSGQGIY